MKLVGLMSIPPRKQSWRASSPGLATGLGLSGRAGLSPAALALLLAVSSLALPAQDTVTIPKSRLEELERKEAELQKLKQGATNAPVPNVVTPSAQPGAAATIPSVPAAEPVVTRPSPPVASLPPLREDEIVESLDLANQFRADPIAAQQRYHGQKITVRGTISGFEKPMFRGNYRILLPGPDRATMVICDLLPPQKYTAVFTAEHGAKLIGQFGENRQTLAQVGQTVLVHGRCRGMKDASVFIIAENFEQIR